jgi:hypothetical protein
LKTSNVDRICDSGTTLTPSVGAELIATPAAPWPAVEQQLDEQPARGVTHEDRRASRSARTDSRWATTFGSVVCSIGVGSAFSASTSTSKPGYAGAITRWPLAS